MQTQHPDWPVLTRYSDRNLKRVALPLGGIGGGTVSLGGRGNLHDWEVMNRPAKGFTPSNSFLAVRIGNPDGEPIARALEGVLQPHYEAARGEFAPNHGLPRFRNCEFLAAYPFGQVLLSDPDVPVTARIEAFNPLIPADADRSGYPAAVLRVVLQNPTARDLDVSVAFNVQNFIGYDGSNGYASRNYAEFKDEDGLSGLILRSFGVDPASEQWGTLAIAGVSDNPSEVSRRRSWAQLTWGDSLLDFWDDFLDDGKLEDRALEPAVDGGPVVGQVDGVRMPSGDAPIASLCLSRRIGAGKAEAFTFLLGWHFPNRKAWGRSRRGNVNNYTNDTVGNHYATRFADAWAVTADLARDLPALEAETKKFVSAFVNSDLPDVVKEAALYNTSTLRTQTAFRTTDGRFYGWEGCNDHEGSCLGSCTHVWNYEQATPFLFGALSRSMREVEFAHATRDDGHMSFRVLLPLEEHALDWGLAAADGQMGCVMKLYRDWQLSGDDQFLQSLWPMARKSLEYCWVPGGWDADKDGVMEGCQHNTMDVEYYGPNPQMGIWYLGALRAAEEMARHLGETEFADECRALFVRGRDWLDANLFNGEYYEHQIWPPAGPEAIAPGLRHETMGAQNLTEPELQLGAGCLVDQLVGQYLAHVCGLGDLVDRDKARATLSSIMRYNFKESLFGHFNHMRTFALNDEAALLMASYPRGNRPTRPFPYYNEVMTGFEYTAAVHMLYEGMTEDGLKAIGAIRNRYDGERRSPFNEAECGHHYSRAMASWAAVLALTGFHYSGVTGELTVSASEAGKRTDFWSTGDAWGTLVQDPNGDSVSVVLSVLGGSLKLDKIVLTGFGEAPIDAGQASAGDVLTIDVARAPARTEALAGRG